MSPDPWWDYSHGISMHKRCSTLPVLVTGSCAKVATHLSTNLKHCILPGLFMPVHSRFDTSELHKLAVQSYGSSQVGRHRKGSNHSSGLMFVHQHSSIEDYSGLLQYQSSGTRGTAVTAECIKQKVKSWFSYNNDIIFGCLKKMSMFKAPRWPLQTCIQCIAWSSAFRNKFHSEKEVYCCHSPLAIPALLCKQAVETKMVGGHALCPTGTSDQAAPLPPDYFIINHGILVRSSSH